jgi:hypothetical protein
MSKQDNTPVQDLIYNAAITALNSSEYRDSTREIKKAYVIGWLVAQLKMEYRTSYELKRRIDHILNGR